MTIDRFDEISLLSVDHKSSVKSHFFILCVGHQGLGLTHTLRSVVYQLRSWRPLNLSVSRGGCQYQERTGIHSSEKYLILIQVFEPDYHNYVNYK